MVTVLMMVLMGMVCNVDANNDCVGSDSGGDGTLRH